MSSTLLGLAVVAHAQAPGQGYYTGPILTGGLATWQGDTPPGSPYSTNPSTNLYGIYESGTNPSCAGKIEAQWIWHAATPTAPVPQQVIVKQFASASWSALTNGGQCADGLNDPVVTTLPSQPGGDYVGTSSGTHYSVVPADANGNMELYCTPTASVRSGAAGVYYMASASPVTINLGGTKIVNGMPEALTGQPITVSLTGLPAGCTFSNHKWGVQSQLGGSLCGGYIAQQAQGITTPPSPLNSPSVTLYDGIQDTVTVSVTATVTFPDKTTNLVNANATLVVAKPTVTSHAFSINGANSFMQHPNDTGSALGAQEDWSNVAITMPTGFSGGNGCFAQTLVSTSIIDTRQTGSNYTIKEKLSNGQWVAIPAPCLDTNFPYPYANVWTVGASGANGVGTGGDTPYFPVAPVLDAADTGMADWYKASGSDSFLTWVMYNPNPQSTNCIWVPLANFDWNWKSTAALNNSLTPMMWQAGAFSGDAGSDFAPTGVWPTWNTWIPFTIINNSPTGTVAMHP